MTREVGQIAHMQRLISFCFTIDVILFYRCQLGNERLHFDSEKQGQHVWNCIQSYVSGVKNHFFEKINFI